MLSPGYTQRINIQAIAEFIIEGEVLEIVDPGMPQEREKKHWEEIEKDLRRLVRRSSTHWDEMSDSEKESHYERETDKIRLAMSKVNRLYLEVGAMVGVRLSAQYRETDQNFPELPPGAAV